MTTTELRDYVIADGALEQFVEEWRRGVVPLRRAHGYRVDAAWTIAAERRFLWLLSLDVEPAEWEARNDAYYADPAREALDPDPARLIESQRRSLLTSVELQAGHRALIRSQGSPGEALGGGAVSRRVPRA